METRSKYLNAAIRGNGSIPPSNKKNRSGGKKKPKVSMTPEESQGNLKNPGTDPTSNTAQNHFGSTTSPIGQVNLSNWMTTPTNSQMNVNNVSAGPPPPVQRMPQPQQTSQSTSVSRVNRGAQGGRSFVATLGPSMGDSLINYGTSDGQKTYKRATSGLKDEYNGTSDGITIFCMQLEQKAENEGWSNDTAGDCVDPNSGMINVIKERTQITEEAIQLWAATHIVQQSINPGRITRKAQNNKNLVETITNSLEKDCPASLGLKEERYIIGGVVIGALMYKVLMEGAELETMVTSANIRTTLQNSDQKLVELEHNVKLFADFIRKSKKKLHACGETTNDKDLILSLFRTLKSAPDVDFSDHFKKEHLLYLSGMKHYDVEKLLSDAELMYSVKVDNNDWGKLSKAEEELVAMKADFKDLNLRFGEEKKKKKKNKKMRKSTNANNNSSGSSRRNRNGPQLHAGEEWKLANDDNKTSCVREGKTWYWCLNHNDGKGMWTIHKPSKCRSRNCSRSNQSSPNTDEQAMPATVDSDSDSDSESSDF